MIRDFTEADREIFLLMAESFYSSDAVAHNVGARNFEITFDTVMNKSPFASAFMIEESGEPIGYALLSFTYSNEVGGMVVLIEELYINELHRGKGYASKFFEFLQHEYPSAKRFRLEVRRDNQKAIALYQRLEYSTLDYIQMVKDL